MGSGGGNKTIYRETKFVNFRKQLKFIRSDIILYFFCIYQILITRKAYSQEDFNQLLTKYYALFLS